MVALIIFPVILRTVINVTMLSTTGQEGWSLSSEWATVYEQINHLGT